MPSPESSSAPLAPPLPTPPSLATQGTQSPNRESNRQQRGPLTAYKMVMTPVNFVTFLVSLLLVDMRYTRVRMHSHSSRGSRLPTWLHDVVYRRQPYDDVGEQRAGTSHEEWHYHSNQKKLMKMEAEEAFRLRSTVLILLAVLAATATGGVLYVGTHLLRNWHGWRMAL